MTDSIRLTPPVNWAEIQARMRMAEVKRKAALMDARAALLADLRALGVTEIEGRYDGYGDSGNSEYVGCCSSEPDSKVLCFNTMPCQSARYRTRLLP